MYVMGTNRWDFDVPKETMVDRSLEFADEVRDAGIARLLTAWIAEDARLLWCSWETEDLDALQRAFDALNERTGLVSELTPVETYFPEVAAA